MKKEEHEEVPVQDEEEQKEEDQKEEDQKEEDQEDEDQEDEDQEDEDQEDEDQEDEEEQKEEDNAVQEPDEENNAVQEPDEEPDHAVPEKIGTSMTFTKEKEFALQEFAKLIEWRLSTIKYKRYKYTSITYFTGFKIDGIALGIHLGRNRQNYYDCRFFIADGVLKLEDNTSTFYVYKKYKFKDILSVLKHIEEVKTTYKWIEHHLLSPKKIKFAKMQRIIYTPDTECSVCFEPTTQYTECNHPLCFSCRYKCVASDNCYCPICKTGELETFPSKFVDELDLDSDSDSD